MAQDKELESFKSINLTQYAASLGYVLDKKRSSKTSAVMKLRGDKVVIAIDSSDHHGFSLPWAIALKMALLSISCKKQWVEV